MRLSVKKEPLGAPFKPGVGLSGIPRHSPNNSFSDYPIPHGCTTLHFVIPPVPACRGTGAYRIFCYAALTNVLSRGTQIPEHVLQGYYRQMVVKAAE